MSIQRVLSAKYIKRLALLIAPICFFSTLTWYYFEDITQPWLPPRPRNVHLIEKAVVVPTVKLSELKWIKAEKELLGEFEWLVYCKCRAIRHPDCHIPRTKQGREAAAYLSYILDYYDQLPKYSIFIRSGGQQWHNDILGTWTFPSLLNFRYEAVDLLGFANLRCRHDPDCPWSVKPLEESEHEKSQSSSRERFASNYQHVLNVTREEVPDVLGATCCAQFVVTRERILSRPRSDYERMLQWLMESDVETTFDKGWFFELTWHVIFGREPLNCPRVEQCRCDLYGWCGPLTSTGEILKAIGTR